MSRSEDWETVAKMALIARDLMVGNPKLAEMGYGEEALGRNALAQVFKDNVPGRIIFRPGISWRLY